MLTLSNTYISETKRPIATKFYLKHYWAGGKAAFDFGLDRIRTLVPMATNSSHRVKMGGGGGNRVITLAPSFMIRSSSCLQVMRKPKTSQTSSKFGQIGLRTAELAVLERLEKFT